MALGFVALGLKSLLGGKKPPKPGKPVKVPEGVAPTPAQTAPVSEPVAVPKAPKVKRATVSSPLFKKTEITSIDKSLEKISKSLGNIKASVQTDIKFKKEKQKGVQQAAVKKKRTRREREQERGGMFAGALGGIKGVAKSGTDWIKNFLLNVVVGSVAAFLLKNIEKVIQFVKDVRDKIKEVIEWVDDIILQPIWKMAKAIIGPIFKLVQKFGILPDFKGEENELLKLANELTLQIPILGDHLKDLQDAIRKIKMEVEDKKDVAVPPADRPDYQDTDKPSPSSDSNDPFRNTNEAGVYTGDRQQPSAPTPGGGGGQGGGKWQPILELIAKHEAVGGSYDSIYPSSTKPGLSNMTIAEADAWQARTASQRGSAAAGRYQFMYIKDQAAAAGIGPNEKFSPENQDKMAISLITKKRGVTWDMIKNNPNEAMIRLGQEWASLPMPVAMQGHNRFVQAGQSYYAGDGLNKAGATIQEVKSALGAAQVTPPARRPGHQPSQPTASRIVKNTYKGLDDKNIIMSSPYGMRTHPITGQYKMHTGIDIAPPGTGYDVGLKVSGTVTRVDNNPGGYGLFIIITSQQTGMSYMFAHMDKIYLKNGQQYNAGAPIGEIGNTGGSTGIHLHYEVYKGGATGPAVDPTPYVNLLTIGKETTTNTNRNVAKLTQPSAPTPNRVDRSASYDNNRGGRVVMVQVPPPSQPTGAGAMMSGNTPVPAGGKGGGNAYTYLKSWVKNKLYKQ